MAVAPEFGADVLIRLAESRRVDNRAAKMDLLKNAFYLASAAEQPVKMGALRFTPDTHSGYLALAFRTLKIDKLSLQSRVVSDMLPLDASKARSLLGEVRFPTLSPVGCREPLTYDVALFYQTVGLVSRKGFTTKEKLAGGKLALLSPYVGYLQSHSQVRPAVQLLLNADLSREELSQLSNAFAHALSQLRGDERSFSMMNMYSDENTAPASIAELVAALEAKQLSSVPLLRALREYLVANFSGERCGEEAGKDAVPGVVKEFNRRFGLALRIAQIAPIDEEELKGAAFGPKSEDVNLWQSPRAKQMLTDAQELRFGDGLTELTSEERATATWSSALTDFLTRLAEWKSDGESAVDLFDEKSSLYSSVTDLVANGPKRSEVIGGFVEFLEQNSEQAGSRMEWMLTADHLLSGLRAADDRQEVLQAFLDSRDSALSLYARLERWEPREARPVLGQGAAPAKTEK